MNKMLKAALRFNLEGLNVIPCKSHGKAPALATWEEYQTRISTRGEIQRWFGDNGNSPDYNVGLVHCQLPDNGPHFISLDFDHDAGLFATMQTEFPSLFAGRLEQSGSGEGYHLPLLIDTLPDLGYNQRRERPKGNRTWKTDTGSCNIRIANCQTVAPPSIHPSGNRYRFLQDAPLVHVPDLADVIAWVDALAPVPAQRAVTRRTGTTTPANGSLLEAVKSTWTTLGVFEHFGLVRHGTRPMSDGETKVSGNGGLTIARDDETFYSFSDECGGGTIEAWVWCRYGNTEAKRGRFREVLLEMAQAANLDTASLYRQGDERVAVQGEGDRQRWTRANAGRWGRLR